ncbi:MAG: asparagine synthase C-terminal domain-containing protein [Betaproteobacteria bacterium]|nr:asparagine synthase C-terminal domain-containing protein [Betaproteobacteria bacterium]
MIDRLRQSATLLVDRFSIETVCYRLWRGGLAFSDSASAVPGSKGEHDSQSIYDYLYLHVIPAPQTIFRDVARLRAAHRLTTTARKHSLESWWVPQFVEDDRHDMQCRMRTFVEAVERSVAEEADEPHTACFLSGGTDSSTVAGMLRRLRGGPVHAYSIGFEAEGYDEMEYARIAARHFGLEHHEHYLTPSELADAMPDVAAHFDQPFGNSSALPAHCCALKAREDGFTRMLAGDGGDELYGGNARYATQKVFELYHQLPAALRGRVLEPRHGHDALSPRARIQAGGRVRAPLATSHARPS